jgi:flavin reductase (DIM6/NTAB) family NADH-FMN oxidoreductase RutF
MQRSDIPVEKFMVPVVRVWDRQWLLLTAGDLDAQDYNCMIVGWGSFGVVWGKPFAQVFVRPSRYTWEFMEKAEGFTLCAFGETHRKVLSYFGSRSGRDEDKVKATGLTPIRSRVVRAPGFQEAELVVECRRTYFDDLEPRHFLDKSIEKNYPKNDHHRVYFGEIVAISGTPAWQVKE